MHIMYEVPTETSRGCQISLGLELADVSAIIWALGTKLRSSASKPVLFPAEACP